MQTQWIGREELLEDFEVEAFSHTVCVVIRKSDNVRGILDFTNHPRVYFNFRTI